METVKTSLRDQKLEELGYRFVKANLDFENKKITQVDLAHEVQDINQAGKYVNIDPNEILSNAMANGTAYRKQIESLEEEAAHLRKQMFP